MLLVADNLCKKLSSHRGEAFHLKNINIHLEESRVLCIIGKSGAGKSTLLRLLGGIDQADTGAVYFQDINLYASDKRKTIEIRRAMSLVSQGYHLLSNRTVFDNVVLPLVCQNLQNAHIEKRVMSALEQVGLDKLKDSYPSQLSGGQRQRVAIARAIVTKPKLLLCDEITSALDPQTTDEILDLLKKIKRDLKLGIILITHDLQVVKKIADEVCVIDKGKVVEHGKVFDVLINPKHAVTKSLAENLINREFPAFLRHQIHPCSTAGIDDIVLKLEFDNKSSTKPIISALMENFHVPVNIIAGTLDHIGMETFGHLYISMRYSPSETKKILQFLTTQNVTIETIGYIQWA